MLGSRRIRAHFVAIAVFAVAATAPAFTLKSPTLLAPDHGALVHETVRSKKIEFKAEMNLVGPGWNTNGGSSAMWPWFRLTVHPKDRKDSVVRTYEPPKDSKLGTSFTWHESVTVGDLVALLGDDPSGGKHVFEWKVEYDVTGVLKGDPAVSSSEFTLSGPANLAVSADASLASAWPKKMTVRNNGGAHSQPSALEVLGQLKNANDATVKANCPKMDFHKVHTVLGLDPDEKKSFDLPASPVPPSHPASGQHSVVTCNYSLEANLSGDTNDLDPNKKNNHFEKTISFDVVVQ